MDEENRYRKLTEEEIQNLPFDLRICYGIRRWNISANIETVNDWINIFWIDYVDEDGGRKVDGIKRAKRDFENKKNWLIDIINKILMIE